MGRKFRIWDTLLIAPVAVLLALIALIQGGQATLVFGIWGLI